MADNKAVCLQHTQVGELGERKHITGARGSRSAFFHFLTFKRLLLLELDVFFWCCFGKEKEREEDGRGL